MSKVLIYGHSDDCLEVDGDIREEFNSPLDDYGYLHFDEGTVVKAGYDVVDGKGWNIEVVKYGTAKVTVLEPETESDGRGGEDHFSDRLELDGVNKVEFWGSPDGPTKDELESFFDVHFSVRRYTLDQLLAAYRALGH